MNKSAESEAGVSGYLPFNIVFSHSGIIQKRHDHLRFMGVSQNNILHEGGKADAPLIHNRGTGSE